MQKSGSTEMLVGDGSENYALKDCGNHILILTPAQQTAALSEGGEQIATWSKRGVTSELGDASSRTCLTAIVS